MSHSSAEQTDELAPGTELGDYVVRGTLGVGGCATVYVAERRSTGARVALKVLHQVLAASPKMLERFALEVRAVKSIGHPAIVSILELGTSADGCPYYAMELLEGVDLGTMVQKGGRLSPADALALLEPVCEALEAAHAAGIVHRDLKGGNILVSGRGDHRTVKLLDFGVAKLIHRDPSAEGLTTIGRQVGTPLAMAPEQIMSEEVDARTDIYALGVLLFYMLTRRYPFQSDDVLELELMHLDAPPPSPSQFAPLSRAIDVIVLRCLEKAPAKRYASVRDLREELRVALDPAGTARKARASSTGRAVAIAIEARLGPDVGDEPSDAILDDVGSALDHAEEALRAGGFDVALQTGTTLLGTVALDTTAARELDQRRMALELAENLYERLVERHGAQEGVVITVGVHAADAVLQATSEGAKVIGGEILKMSAWSPSTMAAGAYATPDAAAGLRRAANARFVALRR